MNKLKSILIRLLFLFIKIWLAIFAIFFIQSIIEGIGSGNNNTTIIRGEYKQWKPKVWKQPSFPVKQK